MLGWEWLFIAYIVSNHQKLEKEEGFVVMFKDITHDLSDFTETAL